MANANENSRAGRPGQLQQQQLRERVVYKTRMVGQRCSTIEGYVDGNTLNMFTNRVKPNTRTKRVSGTENYSIAITIVIVLKGGRQATNGHGSDLNPGLRGKDSALVHEAPALPGHRKIFLILRMKVVYQSCQRAKLNLKNYLSPQQEDCVRL